MTESTGGLADLLTGHPFSDGQDLINTVDGSVTAGTAREEASRIGVGLRSARVEPCQAVVVQLPNGPEFVFAMFGVWMAGAVFVPANARQPQAELDHVLESTAPACVINVAGVQVSGLLPALYEPDTAFVTWTSGTTGRPKPILQTHT